MKKTLLMGILNVTPDSFFEESRFSSLEDAVKRGITLYNEGADILDIGGESTRPFSDAVSEEEELKRVIPVISALKKEIPIPISIDTMKPAVAREAIKAGATIINDVTGFKDTEMINLATLNPDIKIIVMHMQGTPKTMQNQPFYEKGVSIELLSFFKERIQTLLQNGIKKEQIILDPGIGFGKSVDDNLKIIHNLKEMKDLDFPLLLGISRKSFMAHILGKKPQDLLPATLGLNGTAILSGIDIIRVHDVKEHRMLIDIITRYLEQSK